MFKYTPLYTLGPDHIPWWRFLSLRFAPSFLHLLWCSFRCFSGGEFISAILQLHHLSRTYPPPTELELKGCLLWAKFCPDYSSYMDSHRHDKQSNQPWSCICNIIRQDSHHISKLIRLDIPEDLIKSLLNICRLMSYPKLVTCAFTFYETKYTTAAVTNISKTCKALERPPSTIQL